MKAARQRLTREHNERAWMAWHIAAMTRMKKLPDLSKMLIETGPKKMQTWRQHFAIMEKIAARQRLAASRTKPSQRSNPK